MTSISSQEYEEFRPRTIWSLPNALTSAFKELEPSMDKIMRLLSVCSTIENGFIHLPDRAEWLETYLHEITTFPKGKHDDQTDSTSQALDWAKQKYFGHTVEIHKRSNLVLTILGELAYKPASHESLANNLMSCRALKKLRLR